MFSTGTQVARPNPTSPPSWIMNTLISTTQSGERESAEPSAEDEPRARGVSRKIPAATRPARAAAL